MLAARKQRIETVPLAGQPERTPIPGSRDLLRPEKVLAVRKLLAKGQYGVNQRMDAVLERILDDIGTPSERLRTAKQ